MKHFIILIGGPDRFQNCDRKYDQTWSNYIVPPQLAAMHNSYNHTPDEKVHWEVYKKPYEFRWFDDSAITDAEKIQRDGAWLHSILKKATDKVRSKGAQKTKQASRFYDCCTNGFVQEWHNVFNAPTEGAQSKIDFGVVNRPSRISSVLERITKTYTSKGDPDWTRYK